MPLNFLFYQYHGHDKMKMYHYIHTQTLSKIEVTICNHQVDSPLEIKCGFEFVVFNGAWSCEDIQCHV